MPELTVAQVLRRAAKLLRERGWLQGEYALYDENGVIPGCPLCANGAIHVAAGLNPGGGWGRAPNPAGAGLAQDARAAVNAACGSLYRFNDAFGRTADEVIDLLERVARELEDVDA